MAHPVLPAAELMKVVHDAREAYARKAFDIAVVGAAMKERAGKGFDWLHVRQDQPLRLQGTRAATKLVAWLAQCGCSIDWNEMGTKDADPIVPPYAELCIYWSKSFDMISIPAEKYLADAGYVRGDDGSDKLPGSIG